MKIFWENVARYPRFLITTIFGLITLIIETLFKILIKRRRQKTNKIFNRLFFIFLIISGIIIIIKIITMILNI
jgi:ABC-type Fe3+ transport system permease subunit